MNKLKQLTQYTSYLVFTILVIGVGLAAYGGYSYYTASNRISEIEKEREKIQNIILGVDTNTTDISGVALSDIPLKKERAEKIEVQNDARRMAGIGIALIAVGWLIWDVARGRRRKTEIMPVENDSPSSV